MKNKPLRNGSGNRRGGIIQWKINHLEMVVERVVEQIKDEVDVLFPRNLGKVRKNERKNTVP